MKGDLARLIEKSIIGNVGVPIIVEGNHDIKALRNIGFHGKIMKINSGLSINEFCENYSKTYKTAVILTDFDDTGKKLMNRISELLTGYGVSVETTLWESINKKYRIKSVEDLPWLLEHSDDQ